MLSGEAKKLVPSDTNIGFDRIFRTMEALGCLFSNFEINVDIQSFADVAYKEFSAFYKKHGYECPTGLYKNVST